MKNNNSRKDYLPYSLSIEEKNLCDKILERFTIDRSMPLTLPPIILSLETPPLFIKYPDWDKKKNDQDLNITIESLLGCYYTDPEIILFKKGIDWFAENYNMPVKLLQTVVLIHEIGHFISNVSAKPGINTWQEEHFDLTDPEIHEGWAQLLTWYITKEEIELKQAFDKLNKLQTPLYRNYKRYLHIPENKIIESLFILRNLNRPAELADWEDFLFKSDYIEKSQYVKYYKEMFTEGAIWLPYSALSVSEESKYLVSKGYSFHGFLRLYYEEQSIYKTSEEVGHSFYKVSDWIFDKHLRNIIEDLENNLQRNEADDIHGINLIWEKAYWQCSALFNQISALYAIEIPLDKKENESPDLPELW